MKTKDIISAIIFAVLLVWIFLLISERKVEDRVRQSEIDGLKRKNQVERDSLENVLKLTSDSLDIAFATIRLAKEETQKAKEKSQREIRTLKSILFVQHNDSSRQKELKSLYKSYQ